MANVVTITLDDDANVFIDTSLELVEALGLLELGKSLLIAEATR